MDVAAAARQGSKKGTPVARALAHIPRTVCVKMMRAWWRPCRWSSSSGRALTSAQTARALSRRAKLTLAAGSCPRSRKRSRCIQHRAVVPIGNVVSLSQGTKLDMLVINAAVVPIRAEKTADGLEKAFAVNYLAQFYLMKRIMDEGLLRVDAAEVAGDL
jgi:NAD(P)-dependent dehydrogenase (short-subunit alcohol dehydrogenase family)